MKKILALMFLLLVLAKPCLAQTQEASLSITWQFLDSVLRPGEETTLFLTFTNPSSLAGIRNIKVYLTPGPYLSLSSNYFEIGSLTPLASQQNSLSVRVDSTAISTNSYITLRATYYSDSTQKEINLNLPLTIRRFPSLQILNVNYSKELIEPGSEVKLSFEIFNNGDGSAKDVVITFNQTQLFTVIGSSEKFVSNIDPKEGVGVEFNLIINPDTPVKTYPIPIFLRYYDESRSQLFAEVKVIGIKISGRYNFLITLESQDTLVPGGSGSIEIKIANAGSQAANFLTLKPLKNEVIEQITPEISYLGKLNSDDYDTEKFDLVISENAEPGIYTLPIEIEFQDPYTNAYKSTYNVTFKVSQQLQPSSLPIFLSAIIIAIILVYLVYRKVKK